MIGAHQLTIDANITYRQLDYWTRVGYLTPITRDEFMGSGVPREYPDAEAAVARVMGQLIHAGLTANAAHDAARQITRAGTARLGSIEITIHNQQGEPAA